MATEQMSADTPASDPLLRRLVGIAPDDPAWEPLVLKIWAYVADFMSHFDPSHDFAHIRRVTTLALAIHSITTNTTSTITSTSTNATERPLCPRTVALAALLHDVGDKKYAPPSQDRATMALRALADAGCGPALAERVQTICTAVSYSGEARDPAAVAALIAGDVPELAVVQDADRLDAIGAVGIARAFAYSGARNPAGGLAGVLAHFDEKLVRLEGMMKTRAGREMARARARRLGEFRDWWQDETAA